MGQYGIIFTNFITLAALKLACPAGFSLFSSINECINTTAISNIDFLAALEYSVPCPGGVIATAAELEIMRFCTVISGNLEITVKDPLADYTALWDIQQITGQR